MVPWSEATYRHGHVELQHWSSDVSRQCDFIRHSTLENNVKTLACWNQTMAGLTKQTTSLLAIQIPSFGCSRASLKFWNSHVGLVDVPTKSWIAPSLPGQHRWKTGLCQRISRQKQSAWRNKWIHLKALTSHVSCPIHCLHARDAIWLVNMSLKLPVG